MDSSPCSTGTVATIKACSQSSSDCDSTPAEYPSSLEKSPGSRKRLGVTPPSNGAPGKRGKKEQGTKTAPMLLHWTRWTKGRFTDNADS